MKIKLIDFGAVNMPKRAHYNDAGADVYAKERVVLWPHETIAFPLGFGLELPDGLVAFVFPRSGLSKKGITCELPPIDSGYRGEIHALVTNNSNVKYVVEAGDRIGQVVVVPCVLCDFVDSLGEERGDGAFASTGK